MVTVKLSSRVRCCLLSEGERKQKWVKGLFLFCFFYKNWISSDIFCVSHRFPSYLQFSTSTSADWWHPRSLSENAPPHPSLRPCLAELPVHRCKKNKINKSKKKNENLNFFHLSVLNFLFICTFKFMVTGFESSGSSPSSKRCIILNRIRS